MYKKILLSYIVCFLATSLFSQQVKIPNSNFQSWQKETLLFWQIQDHNKKEIYSNEADELIISSLDKKRKRIYQYITFQKARKGFIKFSALIKNLTDKKDAYIELNIYRKDSTLINRSFKWYNDSQKNNQLDALVFVPIEASYCRVRMGIESGASFSFQDLQLKWLRNPKKVSKKWKPWADALVGIMEENSILRGKIDWKKISTINTEFSGKINNSEKAMSYADYLIKRINDGHTIMLPSEKAIKWKSSKTSSKKDVVSKKTISDFKTAEAKYIGDQIGYIKIPPLPSGDEGIMKEFAHVIRKQLQMLLSKGAKKWIVDLRDNRGGNMWPMVSGLGPLMGEEKLGAFKKSTGNNYWSYKNNTAYSDEKGAMTSCDTEYSLKLDTKYPPVAILVNENTSSSGEFTFMSFCGRPNTKSFGVQTAGYTTGNSQFDLSDGSILFLAASIGIDRTGKEYGKKMTPDVIVKDDKKSAEDDILEAAKNWIKKQS